VNEAANNTPLIASGPKSGIAEDANIQTVENLFAKHASVEADEDNSDDHIFMMEEEKTIQTKAAGFLKKIKRTVERYHKNKTRQLKNCGIGICSKIITSHIKVYHEKVYPFIGHRIALPVWICAGRQHKRLSYLQTPLTRI
jgi:hypothetical protein